MAIQSNYRDYANWALLTGVSGLFLLEGTVAVGPYAGMAVGISGPVGWSLGAAMGLGSFLPPLTKDERPNPPIGPLPPFQPSPSGEPSGTGGILGLTGAPYWQRFKDTLPVQHFDPLVLDLNRDGKVELKNAAFFDLNNSGFHELTTWIDETDAFLVLDKNFSDKIESGAEMFGDAMVLPDGSRVLSGFEALSFNDSNGDGSTGHSRAARYHRL